MNTIRELKQQEKYKNMLKRKNKEKTIYKTQNQTLRIKYEGIKKLLEKKDKEIERLNNELENLEKLNNANYQSFIEANNIIKRLEEFIEEEIKLFTVELTEENKNKLGYTAPIRATYKEIYNVLQELKGDGSNECKRDV